MKRRTKDHYVEVYTKLFRILHQYFVKVTDLVVVCDDEPGHHGSCFRTFKRIFGIEPRIKLCSWHMGKCVERNLAKQKNTQFFKKDLSTYEGSWKWQYAILKRLHYLPEHLFLPTIDIVEKSSSEHMPKFWRYIKGKVSKSTPVI